MNNLRRWPKQLICMYHKRKCMARQLGLEGDLAEISYKGKIITVPMEELKIEEGDT